MWSKDAVCISRTQCTGIRAAYHASMPVRVCGSAHASGVSRSPAWAGRSEARLPATALRKLLPWKQRVHGARSWAGCIFAIADKPDSPGKLHRDERSPAQEQAPLEGATSEAASPESSKARLRYHGMLQLPFMSRMKSTVACLLHGTSCTTRGSLVGSQPFLGSQPDGVPSLFCTIRVQGLDAASP